MKESTHHVSNLPGRIMVWFGQWPITWAGTWATKRYQADAVAYVPESQLIKMKQAAQLGLEMAQVNDLYRTAEYIRKAISECGEIGE